MKQFKPAIFKDKYWLGIEKLIQRIFFDSIYKALFFLTKPEQELYNTKDPLSIAIMDSKVGFNNGSFFGFFNSKITRQLRIIGAKYDKTSKTWKLPTKELPPAIQATLAARNQKDFRLNNDALLITDGVDIKKTLEESGIEAAYNKTINEMSEDINKTIGIDIVLTEEQQKVIADEWTNNLDLSIKNFLQDNILELRKKIYDNTAGGKRAENLVSIIQSQFNVTKSKAKFLARQETSLLMSKMRETRYKDAGLIKYRWLTSSDERVRERHKGLNNKTFFWDEPPIVDEKGNRAHPGEDFNCRCVASPVI